MRHSIQVALFAATAVSISVGVYAAAGNDAQVPPPASVSLLQAIQSAEGHVSGRAVKAEYEATGTPRTWVYDVEVVVGPKVFDVRVDASNGTVISSKEDTEDHDDHEDKED